MQQLKRSYSLTDLGEPQQFDQHRFTDVTEEEAGWFFQLLPFLLPPYRLPFFFLMSSFSTSLLPSVTTYRATVTCSQPG